jgi:trimeric autotransporter adhesin
MLPTSPQLTRLEITPQTSSIALGQTVQFKATGVFNDGSSRDETGSAVWTSGNDGIAGIDANGFATSHSVGSASMSASIQGLSGSATLTISDAAIVARGHNTTEGHRHLHRPQHTGRNELCALGKFRA